MNAKNLSEITDLVLDDLVNKNELPFDKRQEVKMAIESKHSHQYQRRKKAESKPGLPIIRSLAEIAQRNFSSSQLVTSAVAAASFPIASTSSGEALAGNSSSTSLTSIAEDQEICMTTSFSSPDFGTSETMEKDVEANNAEKKIKPDSNTQFMKKVPENSEASSILVGELDILDKPLACFVRLDEAVNMGDLTEVMVPTRFVFILLGPPVSHWPFH